MEKINNNMLVFASYDMKAERYSKPMVSQNTGMMLRSWADIANDKNHPVGQHPEDYCMYQIGEYDDTTGKMIPMDPPKSLGTASGYIKKGDQLTNG